MGHCLPHCIFNIIRFEHLSSLLGAVSSMILKKMMLFVGTCEMERSVIRLIRTIHDPKYDQIFNIT